MSYAIILFSSFLGGLVQSVTGFGSGIVIMLFFPLVLSLLQSSALSAMIAVVLDISLVLQYRKYLQPKLVVLPALCTFVTSTLAVRYAVGADMQFLKLLFGIFLLVLAAYFLFFADKVKLHPNISTAVMCSSMAGVTNGLFGIGGPPMVAYYLSFMDDKFVYIANIQFYFLITSAYATVVRLASGIVTPQLAWLMLPGVLGILAGQLVGGKILHKINVQLMKRLVYGFLAISGVITIIGCL